MAERVQTRRKGESPFRICSEGSRLTLLRFLRQFTTPTILQDLTGGIGTDPSSGDSGSDSSGRGGGGGTPIGGIVGGVVGGIVALLLLALLLFCLRRKRNKEKNRKDQAALTGSHGLASRSDSGSSGGGGGRFGNFGYEKRLVSIALSLLEFALI